MLTEITLNVGIAAAMPSTGQILDRIELLELADRRVLMILVTRDHEVHNRVVMVDEPLSQDDLNSIRNYVNHQFSGWMLGDARRFQLLRDGGSPNLGRTAGSKRVIAEIWVPDRVRTISPTV